MNKIVIVIALLSLLGCTTTTTKPLPLDIEGDLRSLYKQVSRLNPKAYTAIRPPENQNEQHGISEIAIQRGYNFGLAPVYMFTAKKDGSVFYHGEAHVDRKGAHTGKIYEWQFNQLAQFILDSGYLQLKSYYASEYTCQATVYTSIIANGNRKIVKNYGRAGPASLWAVEQLIDQLMQLVQWNETKE